MAKITVGKLSSGPVKDGMKELIAAKLVASVSWKVKTLTNRLNEELKKYQELRKEILDRHAKKGEDGKVAPDEKGNYQFDPAEIEALNKELNDLAAIEVEFDPIRVSELKDRDGKEADLSAELLLNLGDLVDA